MSAIFGMLVTSLSASSAEELARKAINTCPTLDECQIALAQAYAKLEKYENENSKKKSSNAHPNAGKKYKGGTVDSQGRLCFPSTSPFDLRPQCLTKKETEELLNRK